MSIETSLPEAGRIQEASETDPTREIPETEPVQDIPEVTEKPDKRIPGFITTADSLVVRLTDGEAEYEADLTLAERDRIPFIIEDPRNSTPAFERYHIDSRATAVQVEEGKERVWKDLPTRNVISPVVTKDGIRIAILGSEESDRS